MNSREEKPGIPDLKLERFLLGELDPAETARLQGELEGDEALRERLEELRKSNRELLERYPTPMMMSEIARKLNQPALGGGRNGGRERRIRLWPVPALSAAAVAILLLLLLPVPGIRKGGTDERQPLPAGTRVKGLDPRLLLFRKTPTGSERLENGALAREHDLILVGYEAAGMAYGTIFSIDGRGALTRHVPLQGSRPLPLGQDGAVSLDFSYELDDAPRWEKFYFVTSDSLFDLDTVFQAAREASRQASAPGVDSLKLPPSLRQTIFTLRKETSDE